VQGMDGLVPALLQLQQGLANPPQPHLGVRVGPEAAGDGFSPSQAPSNTALPLPQAYIERADLISRMLGAAAQPPPIPLSARGKLAGGVWGGQPMYPPPTSWDLLSPLGEINVNHHAAQSQRPEPQPLPWSSAGLTRGVPGIFEPFWRPPLWEPTLQGASQALPPRQFDWSNASRSPGDSISPRSWASPTGGFPTAPPTAIHSAVSLGSSIAPSTTAGGGSPERSQTSPSSTRSCGSNGGGGGGGVEAEAPPMPRQKDAGGAYGTEEGSMRKKKVPAVVGRYWSNEEHELFIQAISVHGMDNVAISRVVGTRTPLQVRSHAQKFVKKLVEHSSQGLTGLPNMSRKKPVMLHPALRAQMGLAPQVRGGGLQGLGCIPGQMPSMVPSSSLYGLGSRGDLY